MAPPRETTRAWIFTAAQTNLVLLAIAATERLLVTFAQVTAANSNTGDVSITLGTATTTLTIPTADDPTGVSGVFLTHGGIAKGGGEVAGPAAGGGAVHVGGLDEDLRMTCSAAAGGSIRIVLKYRILGDQDLVG
jgi:hypothetical protein